MRTHRYCEPTAIRFAAWPERLRKKNKRDKRGLSREKREGVPEPDGFVDGTVEFGESEDEYEVL